MKIKDVIAREILDSRGNPTVEVELFLSDNRSVIASVPSGASTGGSEALELRDRDKNRYGGKGVLKAVNNINTIIKSNIVGQELNQLLIDEIMIKLDGTPFKSNLGANAILPVSLAVLKASALVSGKEVYEYVSTGDVSLPIPFMNIINGGKHADNGLDIQEFMLVPVVKTFKERLRCGAEIFHSLKEILKEKGYSTSVGDEGGFAPKLFTNEEAFDLIIDAGIKVGYKPGKDFFLAIDVAASSFYDEKLDRYNFEGRMINNNELIRFYENIVRKYPIISIEDPFYEKDFRSFAKLTDFIGKKIMLVGDDFFVTNKKFLEKGISYKAGNAILLKPNQIGTITELIDTIITAKKNGYKMIISHRSGETEDTTIADLSVGLKLSYIKTGSLSRGERICKYNRLLRIEERLIK